MLKKTLKIAILVAGLMAISGIIYSQDDQIPVKDDQPRKIPMDVVHHFDLGFGFGLDYGGLLGIQFGVAPFKHLTLFASGGYYLIGLGWNVGAKLLFIGKTSKHSVRPFLKGMYGCHSVTAGFDNDEYNKIYNGFTVGAGVEFRFGRNKKNGLDFDLNIPLRTPEYWEALTNINNDPSEEVLLGPMPVAISLGFHHEF